jgi:hypothetical protein
MEHSADHKVDSIDEPRDKEARDQNDDRRIAQLFFLRPGDLVHLLYHIGKEADDLLFHKYSLIESSRAVETRTAVTET